MPLIFVFLEELKPSLWGCTYDLAYHSHMTIVSGGEGMGVGITEAHIMLVTITVFVFLQLLARYGQ